MIWPRRDRFTFYQQFANSSFNLCVPIAAQHLYECAKDHRVSFFQLTLYALLCVANGILQPRQCVHNDEVIGYDSLAVMMPVTIVEEGFRQVWCDNALEFTTFSDTATSKVITARETTPVPLTADGEHFICASCLPWPHFISMTRTEYAVGAAMPALTWGKLQDGVIPAAGRSNHAFVDGLRASHFFVFAEKGFSDPEWLRQSLTETAPSLPAPAAKKR